MSDPAVIPTKTTRPRNNSSEVQSERLQAHAAGPLEPPTPLPPTVRVHFDDVVNARERSTWTRVDMTVAVQVAYMLYACAKYGPAAQTSALTVADRFGVQVVNPKRTAYTRLLNDLAVGLRTLGLTATARGLVSEEQNVRNTADREASTVVKKAKSSAGVASLLA